MAPSPMNDNKVFGLGSDLLGSHSSYKADKKSLPAQEFQTDASPFPWITSIQGIMKQVEYKYFKEW